MKGFLRGKDRNTDTVTAMNVSMNIPTLVFIGCSFVEKK